MPAGTGVCVVKTVPARAACSASSNVRPCACDELADALEAEEAGVALVGVEHLGLGGAGDAAERAQRAHAADAEQQLLLEAVLAAAAVQPVGDVALGRGRSPRRRSRAEQRHAADVGAPHVRAQRCGRRAGRPR